MADRRAGIVLLAAAWLAGCIGGEAPLPPGEALSKAAARIDALLEEEQALKASPASPQPVETPEDPGAITFWYYTHPVMSGIAARAERLDAFHKQNPEVRVSAHFIGDWYIAVQKLMVSLAAGDLPDVAVVKRSLLARLIGSGRIVPLDVLLPVSLVADIRPQACAALSASGHLYAFPADGFCSVLFYNRDLVGENPPKNREELRRIAQNVTRLGDDPSKDVYGLGDIPFVETLWSAGGKVCDGRRSGLDAPEAQEALAFLLSLRDQNIVHPQALGRSDYAFDLFLLGRAAMTVASSQCWPRAQKASFAVGIGPVPGKNGPISSFSEDAVIVFTRYAGAKSEAIARFLDYLTGPEVQGDEAVAIGSAPVRSSVAQQVKGMPGLDEAFLHARGTPLIGPWAEIEFELHRYLDLAYRWKAETGG